MKRISLALVALACLTCTTVNAQESSSWFDLENCAVCKNMSGQEGLLQNIKWENHVIPNGMLSIAVIPDDYKDVMDTAHKGMEATLARLQNGEAMHLCGFCESYGALKAMGAKSTELKTVGGDISMMTSDDPAVVTKIQAHAKKSIDEFAKMMEHNHDHPHEEGHKKAG